MGIDSMDKKVKILDGYSKLLRGAVNGRVMPSELSPYKVIGGSKPEDWGKLCASMDCIDQTSLAINDFLMVGLHGHTRPINLGEPYLRLCGTLTVVYNQQAAVSTIYNIFSVSNIKNYARNKINSLHITDVRHIGIHTINHKDNNGNTESYKIVIGERDTFTFQCVEYTRVSTPTLSPKILDIDLKQDIYDHLILMIQMMDKIVEKAINYLYEGASNKKRLFFLDELNDLRKLRKGWVKFDGGWIILPFNIDE